MHNFYLTGYQFTLELIHTFCCFDARALVGGCQWESMNVLRGIVGNPEAGLRGWRAPSPLSASGQPWLDNTLMLLIQTTTSALWLEHGGSDPFAGSDCCSLLVAALCCSRSFLLQTWLLPFSCHSLHLLLLAGEQFNWFLRLPVSGIFRDSSPLAGHHGIELGTSFIYFGVWVVCFDTHGAPSSPNAPPGCYKGTAYKVDKKIWIWWSTKQSLPINRSIFRILVWVFAIVSQATPCVLFGLRPEIPEIFFPCLAFTLATVVSLVSGA